MSARVVIISGPPGTGKTSISKVLAEKSLHDRAVHIQLDDFWQCIRKGYIHPWLDNSAGQNETVIEAAAASARMFVKSGYEVFVDGVLGPWFLKPWVEIAKSDVDVRYIILRPDEDTTIFRAANRQQREHFPLNSEIIKNVWNSFSNLDKYEPHTLNTTGQTVEESTTIIQSMLLRCNYRII